MCDIYEPMTLRRSPERSLVWRLPGRFAIHAECDALAEVLDMTMEGLAEREGAP